MAIEVGRALAAVWALAMCEFAVAHAGATHLHAADGRVLWIAAPVALAAAALLLAIIRGRRVDVENRDLKARQHGRFRRPG